MDILHIDTGWEMRGGQRQVLLTMKGLRTAGHGCVLLARKGGPLWEAAACDGFEVHAASLGAVRRWSAQAEIVHAHDARAHTWAALAARDRLVVSRRVAFPIQRNFLSGWKYGRARRFLAVSEAVAEQLAEAHVGRSRIDVVYDGVELTALPPPVSEFRCVTPDSRDTNKGRDLAVEAGRLAGIDLIYSSELARDLPGAACFLYLTRSEGLGSAALLAMNFALPVIASRVGGLVEVVEDGCTGLLVDNEPQAIAGALRRLASDSLLRATMGRLGRKRVERCFSMTRLVEGTLESYAKAMGPG